jgi:hypothetical protein
MRDYGKKNLGLIFFLKHGRKLNNTEMYIYLRITVDGRSNELSTKRLWAPANRRRYRMPK